MRIENGVLFEVDKDVIEITIPDSVTDIGSHVFVGCGNNTILCNITILCNSGSYAESYARSRKIAYKTID